MKRLIPLLLACLLLLGCSRNTTAEETDASAAPSGAAISRESFASVTLVEEPGGLQTYLLPQANAYSVKALGDCLLVLSGESATTLTLLSATDMSITASLSLEFYLDVGDPSLQLRAGQLSYYDPVNRQSVVLDETLKEVSHISAPEGLVGTPILSSDRNTLYYCTATAIRAWDLETGIRRMVKELSYKSQAVTGLHWDDTVLECTIQDGDQTRTLFIAVDTGRLVGQVDAEVTLSTLDGYYYASFPSGALQALVFGKDAGPAQMLLPEDPGAEGWFLPLLHGAVSVSTHPETGTSLTYYDLTSGTRSDEVALTDGYTPIALTGSGGSVFFLTYRADYGRSAVVRWDVSGLSGTAAARIGSYASAGSPGTAALSQCQRTAAEIGSKYGLEVLVWKDATAVQPWDYDLEPEYQAPVLQRELELLDARLSQYPQEVLTATASHFTSLKICLVRHLTGTAESGSLSRANGLQFFQDGSAYVVLAVGRYSDRELYHELFHVMETHILSESSAYDRWDELNPSGFSYDYNYRTNAQRDSGVYLSKENRAFVDTYSMSFPSEDRARIMEYAMLPGNQDLFREEVLQAKLATLCKGIREAYGLKKSTETFLWEQYLK